MKNILLIEDDQLTVEVYEKAFERYSDFKIESLIYGKMVWEKLKELKEGKEKPALILLDLVMPDIDGYEVFKDLKADKLTCDIPIFILTNYTDPVLTQEILKQGADRFIVKVDHTPHQVVDIVKEALKAKK